jgi:hypothetical protein
MARPSSNEAEYVLKSGMFIATPVPDPPSRLSLYNAYKARPIEERCEICCKHFEETPFSEAVFSAVEEEKQAAINMDKVFRAHDALYPKRYCIPYEQFLVAETAAWLERMHVLIAHVDGMPEDGLRYFSTGSHRVRRLIPALKKLTVENPGDWYSITMETLVNHKLLSGVISRHRGLKGSERTNAKGALTFIIEAMEDIMKNNMERVDVFVSILAKKFKSFAHAAQDETLKETLWALLTCVDDFNSIKVSSLVCRERRALLGYLRKQ